MIYFDLILATRRGDLTGIERYGINLFKEYRKLDSSAMAFVMNDSFFEDKTGVVKVNNALINWIFLPLGMSSFGFDDVLVCPSFPASPLFRWTRGIRILRVIHDAFPWTRGDAMTKKGLLMFRSIEEFLLQRYDYVCSPTEIAGSEISMSLKSRGLKIDVMCCGNARGIDVPGNCGEVVPELATEKYVLAVGTVEPRKNYEKIVDVAERLSAHGLTMVIAGRPGWGGVSEWLDEKKKDCRSNIIWLKNVTDREMVWLYQNSKGFISASQAEGFNMPLVEAGCLGIAVVCSDLPIHREVAPPWAQFFSLESTADSVAEMIVKGRSAKSVDAVRAYSERYTWSSVARNVMGICK